MLERRHPLATALAAVGIVVVVNTRMWHGGVNRRRPTSGHRIALAASSRNRKRSPIAAVRSVSNAFARSDGVGSDVTACRHVVAVVVIVVVVVTVIIIVVIAVIVRISVVVIAALVVDCLSRSPTGHDVITAAGLTMSTRSVGQRCCGSADGVSD
jgi:Flp pilus assembly protein TadB